MARWLSSGPQQIILSDLLQGTAQSLRTAYIEYIGKLGVELDSPDWWFSSLSEKSPTMSKAFLHTCYAAVAADKDHGLLMTGSNPLAFKKARATLHCVDVRNGKTAWSKPDVGEYHGA